VAAFSSQQKVTDQRDIVIKPDRFPAIGTPRTGKNDGLPLGTLRMQTLRKLPINAPKMMETIVNIVRLRLRLRLRSPFGLAS